MVGAAAVVAVVVVEAIGEYPGVVMGEDVVVAASAVTAAFA